MHESEEVDDPGDYLESKVERSAVLHLSAGGAIADETTEERDEHHDKAEEHIDAHNIVQPGDVGADEGGREHDELSQPLDDVEGGSKANERLIHWRGILPTHIGLALS